MRTPSRCEHVHLALTDSRNSYLPWETSNLARAPSDFELHRLTTASRDSYTTTSSLTGNPADSILHPRTATFHPSSILTLWPFRSTRGRPRIWRRLPPTELPNARLLLHEIHTQHQQHSRITHATCFRTLVPDVAIPKTSESLPHPWESLLQRSQPSAAAAQRPRISS